MTRTSAEAAPRINDVENRHDAPRSAGRPLDGQLLRRRRIRRLDLATLQGTARESAKTYRQLVSGEISMAECETRSRALRRHSEILAALEEVKQLDEIKKRLDQLAAAGGVPAVSGFLLPSETNSTETDITADVAAIDAEPVPAGEGVES